MPKKAKKINEANGVAFGRTEWDTVGKVKWYPEEYDEYVRVKGQKHKEFVERLFAKEKNKKNSDDKNREKKFGKYCKVANNKSLAGDYYLFDDDSDFTSQEETILGIARHQEFNRNNPRHATFFVSIAEHFGSNSLKNILKDVISKTEKQSLNKLIKEAVKEALKENDEKWLEQICAEDCENDWDEKEAEWDRELEEASSVGGGSIVGYTAPLGMPNPNLKGKEFTWYGVRDKEEK
jgi:hypothetical protein